MTIALITAIVVATLFAIAVRWRERRYAYERFEGGYTFADSRMNMVAARSRPHVAHDLMIKAARVDCAGDHSYAAGIMAALDDWNQPGEDAACPPR